MAEPPPHHPTTSLPQVTSYYLTLPPTPSPVHHHLLLTVLSRVSTAYGSSCCRHGMMTTAFFCYLHVPPTAAGLDPATYASSSCRGHYIPLPRMASDPVPVSCARKDRPKLPDLCIDGSATSLHTGVSHGLADHVPDFLPSSLTVSQSECILGLASVALGAVGSLLGSGLLLLLCMYQ